MARFFSQALRHVKAAVEQRNLRALARQSPRHIAAHATQSDDTEFHT